MIRKTQTRLSIWGSVLALGSLLGCSSSDGEHTGSSVAQQLSVTPLGVAPAGTTATAPAYDAKSEVNFQLTVPADVTLSSLAVSGGAVSLGDRAKFLNPNGSWAAIAGTASEIQVGVATQTGNLSSVGGVFLANTAHVHGNVRVGGAVRQATGGTYIIDGTRTEHTTIPLRTLTRKARFTAPLAAVSLEPNTKLPAPLAPGNYASLSIKNGAEVVLTAGDYKFGDFSIDSIGSLVLDDSAGAIFVYATGQVQVKGKLGKRNGSFPAFELVSLGAGQAFVSSPFRGSLIAPNGSIDLERVTNDKHAGSFFGKSILVAPDTTIEQHALPWLIRSVTLSKPTVCPGESVQVRVVAQDPATAQDASPLVTINGGATPNVYDQFLGAPGKRMIPVAVAGSDGSFESQIASVAVVACPSNQAPFPQLYAAPNAFHADTVDLRVANAVDYDDGTASYHWDFGDGSVLDSPSPAVSHPYSWTSALDVQHRAVDVTVTVKRAGLADVSGIRTFVVWNSYAISKTRGAIEPPIEPVGWSMQASGTGLVGSAKISNLETSPLTFTTVRVDEVPCDPNARVVYGTTQATSVAVPAQGTAVRSLSVATVQATTCALNFNFWGATAAGTKAQSSVQLDLPRKLQAGVAVSARQAAILNYLVSQKLVGDPLHVSEEELVNAYNARKIPSSVFSQIKFGGTPPMPGDACDPDNVGAPPRVGYSCQPTGGWNEDSDGSPTSSRIANAQKGDAVLVRSCTGFVGSLLGGLTPPQKYTHSGMLTNNMYEITESTGEEGWLQAHPNGILGEPTDGFDEHALRFLWPGTLTLTVNEAFVGGRGVNTPEGSVYKVGGFSPQQVRCSGDLNVVYPSVVKPPPEQDAQVRDTLRSAADFAKTIRSHYRFSSYSSAQATPANDPNGPQPIDGGDGRSQTYGAVPSVCSQLVRFGLLGAGAKVDTNKAFPIASDVTNGPADGLFYYSPDNRRAAADLLYSGLYNTVEYQLALLPSKVDGYWWIGTVIGGAVAGPIGAGIGTGVGIAVTQESDKLAKWTTDAPDDVANQVTNCFASDFCSEDAKDSDRWKSPGAGFAVSPDDLMNYYDSPQQSGGVYGYHERMVYRGKRYVPVFVWAPAAGTASISGVVVTTDNTVVPAAAVTIKGIDGANATTAANGTFSIPAVPQGNLLVHAQKMFGTAPNNELREGDACYVPASNLGSYVHVDCTDFSKVLEPTPVNTITVVLLPPKKEFRKVIFQGAVNLVDCDCCAYETCPDTANPTFYRTCSVSPLQREDSFSIGQTELCADEVGLNISGKCVLLDDNATVEISGTAKFYEEGSKSCGASDQEDSTTFDEIVPADKTEDVYLKNLYNYGTCETDFPPFPFACNDEANFSTVTAQNQVAD